MEVDLPGTPISRITTKEAPHKQIYDQGGSVNLNDSRPTNSITTEEAPQKQNCCPELPKQNCCPGGSPEVQGLQGLREERRGSQRSAEAAASCSEFGLLPFDGSRGHLRAPLDALIKYRLTPRTSHLGGEGSAGGLRWT